AMDELAGRHQVGDGAGSLTAWKPLLVGVDADSGRPRAEVPRALLDRPRHLCGERLQFLGVLFEVLGPLVPDRPQRLAGETACDDGAVLRCRDDLVLVV